MIAARGIAQRILGTMTELTPSTTVAGWIGNVAWTLYLAALLIGCAVSTTRILLPLFPATDDGRMVAIIGGALGGMVLFAVLGGLSTLALCWVLNALGTGHRTSRCAATRQSKVEDND